MQERKRGGDQRSVSRMNFLLRVPEKWNRRRYLEARNSFSGSAMGRFAGIAAGNQSENVNSPLAKTMKLFFARH